LAPFVAAYGVALLLAVLGDPERLELALAAGLLIAVTGTAVMSPVWSRVPDGWTLAPVISLCVAVHLLRAASGGGNAAGYGSLLLLPIVWQAMRRPHRELVITVVLVSLTNLASVFWLPTPVTTAAQWRQVILFSLISATIGETIHRLVNERLRLLAEIAKLALVDQLTGLPNRRLWDDRLPAALADASRSGRPLAVAIIDLDHFKRYNDHHGHQAGDRLLHEAAAAWTDQLRAADLLARWGGEEFALLLPGADRDDASEVLQRLLEATPDGQTFSAGVALIQGRGTDSVGRVMAAADAALYDAKDAGRACIRTSSVPAIAEARSA